MVQRDFYPRSPCGERHVPRGCCVTIAVFLSTLSLRRATNVRQVFRNALNISIHALLAESDQRIDHCNQRMVYFYPRSPCGERRQLPQRPLRVQWISIHALLAESDEGASARIRPVIYFYPRSPCGERQGASARIRPVIYFYPRSPCGERQ